MSKEQGAKISAYGVRTNADSAAYLAALKLAREPKAFCDQHPAFHADNCPSCGTSR